MRIKTKRFSLRVVLTVTTGRLLTKSKGPDDNGIADLYEILGWMTNDSPFTHQLGRFSNECKPWLLRWFPELMGVDDLDLMFLSEICESLGPEEGCNAWLRDVARNRNLKDEYSVSMIPRDDHTPRDPVAKLVEMVGDPKKVVVVVPSAPEDRAS
jgi:hypothetical protein